MAKAQAAGAEQSVREIPTEMPGADVVQVRGRNMCVYCARGQIGHVAEHVHDTLQISAFFAPVTCVLRWPVRGANGGQQSIVGPALVMIAPGQAHAWEWEHAGDALVLQIDRRLHQKLLPRRFAAVAIAGTQAVRDLMVWQFANALRQLCLACDPLQIPLLGLVAESVFRRVTTIIGRDATPPERSLTAALLAKVQEFVRAQLPYDIHIDDLARCVGYSVPHFCELFKAAMGMTPADYIFEQRMVRAEELLRTGNYLIGQVARLVGYFDQGHFTGLFREYFGYAPKLVLQQARVDSANRPKIS